jgi:hypothetical protein
VADIFEEVDEELRQDEYQKYWDRYGAWVIGTALTIVALTAGFKGWEYLENSRLERASNAFVAAQTDYEADRLPLAAEGFEALAREGSAGYASLALMQRAAVALDAGEPEMAASYFDEAASQSNEPLIRDLAVLKAVWIRWADLTYFDIEFRLRDLTGDTDPYRYLARETIAAAALRAGDDDVAREGYQFLSFNLDTPEGVRGRAREALALIAQRSPAEAEEPEAVLEPVEDETVPEENASEPTEAEEAGEAGND